MVRLTFNSIVDQRLLHVEGHEAEVRSAFNSIVDQHGSKALITTQRLSAFNSIVDQPTYLSGLGYLIKRYSFNSIVDQQGHFKVCHPSHDRQESFNSIVDQLDLSHFFISPYIYYYFQFYSRLAGNTSHNPMEYLSYLFQFYTRLAM